MKAVVYTKYGAPDVLQLTEVDKPIPQVNEVLVKVHATTVNRTDCAMVRAKPFFMRIVTGLIEPKKKIPGTEFAGEVEAVGKDVSSLKVGDRVFGFDDEGLESCAQYLTISENKVLTIPDKLSYEEAAPSFEGAHYAYNFINKVSQKDRQNVLVNGATGAIGSAAVQLLKYFGSNVTAVCSTDNINLVKSLGADRVIDYTKDDFTQGDRKYDLILDAVGKSSFFYCRHLLEPGGVYISSDLGFMWQNIFLPIVTPVIEPIFGSKTIFPTPHDIKGSMFLIKILLEKGQFKAVIDRKFPLEQIVEAYRYVEQGHKHGNVVITVE
ncbi:MAG: NAD(P)-dependent alcohol dehydrogenase [Cyanobacteria bacterium P01_G01_bin.19]